MTAVLRHCCLTCRTLPVDPTFALSHYLVSVHGAGRVCCLWHPKPTPLPAETGASPHVINRTLHISRALVYIPVS